MSRRACNRLYRDDAALRLAEEHGCLGESEDTGRLLTCRACFDRSYDYDRTDNGLPNLAHARKRLIEFVSEWGDGEVAEGLHTRDIESLLREI